MDSVLKTVQRFLYIGSDVPFVVEPPRPLDVELGKKILGAVVQPLPKLEEHPPKESAAEPVPNGETVVGDGTGPKDPEPAVPNDGDATGPKKKLKQKKLNAKLNREPEKEGEKAGEEENKSRKAEEATPTEAKATVEPALPKPLHPVLVLIKTAYKTKTIRRPDECLFALAFCARNFPTPDERHAAYEVLVELVRASNDLMKFVAYFMQLATASGSAGFGHGMRVALSRWYDKMSPVELAELLARSAAHAGWTHTDLIVKAHAKLTCPDKRLLIDASTKRTSQLLQKKAPEKKGKKKKAQKENAAEPVLVPLSTSKAFKRYQTVLQFKSASTVGKALELIKLHGGKGRLELMPKHLRRSGKLWEALYPYLSYRELLHAVLALQDFRLLKEGEGNAKAYAETLTKRLDAVETEHIHPIEVQTVAKLYEHGKRYNGSMKQMFHTLSRTEILPPLKAVQAGLNAAFERSFGNLPKTGVRYYIALDLRCVHGRKRTFFNEVVTCFQASVLLAFCIFKREKSVTVVAFTDEEQTLAPVAFEPTMTWEQALQQCGGLMLPKTKVSLAAPIKQAEAQKLKVDVFITITDSLIRVNPNRCPPVAEMTEYRKKSKLPCSRYLAISLNNHLPALEFSTDRDTGGILEMAGYTVNNAKIIEAFAKNLFY